MKSAVYFGDKTIGIEQRDIPEIGEDDVLIEVMAAGVCGTDVHIYHGEAGSADVTPPVVLGHEFSGRVKEIGKNVSGINVGDKVNVDPNIYCGNCEFCRTGSKQLCNHMEAVGVTMDGGFSQYCVAPKEQVHVFNDDVDYEEGAMAEPVACCIHGMDIVKVNAGDRVVVIGGGAIGLIMVQLAKLNGASKVLLSEPVEGRREMGKKMGADYTVNPLEGDLKQQIETLFENKAIDVVIECVGKDIAVEQAINIADKGCRILLFSVPRVDAKIELPLFDVFKKELKIFGSFVNPDTQLRATELINSGRLALKSIITHRFTIDELDKAINKQMEQDSIKVMLKPQE